MRPATLLLLPAAATAFVAPHNASPSFSHSSPATSVPTVTSPLQQTAAGLARMGMSSNSSGDPEVPVSRRKKKEKAIDGKLRSKLLSESIAPWRTVRLFLYGSFGSGALIGGLITLTGVAAAMSGAKPDVDLNTEYLNLGIDFGAVAAFALAFKFDLDKAAELNDNVKEKLKSKRDNKQISKAMKEREATLGSLRINVRISEDGKESREAAVKDVQGGAKQHMIIVVGDRGVIKDALFAANLMQMDFAVRDVLIVPYDLASQAEKQMRPSGGFVQRPTWESAPYVADPTGDGWEEYINEELADAIKQNGSDVKKEGIAIVVKNNGTIIRRGVGKVPWRDMVDELEEKKKDDGVEMADLRFLDME